MDEPGTSSKDSKPKPPPRKKRRLKKKKIEDDEYVDNKKMANSLNQKFQSKKKKDDVPMFEIRNGVAKIKNPESHETTVTRALDYHMNKIFQWELQTDAVESLYICALCHEGVLPHSLGELFGPYYINIPSSKQWPSFLSKRPKDKKQEKIELWFHGECVLWSPNIHMNGGQLSNLDEMMDVYWAQVCQICRKTGASITLQNKKNQHVHYHCAQTKGYKLDEHALTCYSS